MSHCVASPALLPRERHWLVMGSNSSLSLGQMHRKLPSKFSHRASPHSARLISHSFTSEKDRRGGREGRKGPGTYTQTWAQQGHGKITQNSSPNPINRKFIFNWLMFCRDSFAVSSSLYLLNCAINPQEETFFQNNC